MWVKAHMTKSVQYAVYVPADMVPHIEAYCEDTDKSASEAFRDAMAKQLEAHDG